MTKNLSNAVIKTPLISKYFKINKLKNYYLRFFFFPFITYLKLHQLIKNGAVKLFELLLR